MDSDPCLPTRIAVVDFGDKQNEVLLSWLRREGIPCEHVGNMGALFAAVRRSGFDAFLLDSKASEHSEGKVIRWLRNNERTSAPVIAYIPTADPHQVARILRSGADDCMAPPFSARVMMARLIARRRRMLWNLEADEDVWQVGALRMCLRTQRAFVGSLPMSLSQTQFQVLTILARNLTSAVSRDQIHNRVWPESIGQSRRVDTQISRLRSRLRRAKAPVEIVSVSGFGYRLRLLGDAE